jgi:alpha-L-rhamnosidase
MRRFITSSLVLLLAGTLSFAATGIKDFRVQHADSPLSVEDRHPVFSWKIDSDVKGQKQTAYRLSVIREVDGSELWNTGKVLSSQSVDVIYQGVALQAEKGYTVKLSVWDKDGKQYDATTRFETGIMNPRISAWNGADWVGVKQLKLDASSQVTFEIESDFQLRKGDVASFILGADDLRLKNGFLNDFGTQSAENYIKVDVDFGKQELRIWRVGYYKDDKATAPFITVSMAEYPEANLAEVFSARAKDAVHSLNIKVEASQISFILDDKDVITAPARGRGPGGPGGGGGGFSVGMTGGPRRNASNFTLNKLGSGGNFPPFPALNSVGFAAAPGSEVVYSHYRILNAGQSEDREVFCPHHGPGYSIFEGKPGVTVNGKDITVSNPGTRETLIYADPSYGAETMLRTEFTLSDKKVKSARLYASAMGVYNIYLNGKKVGEDWFAPGDSQYRETICYLTYDVTDQLKAGRNALGAELAPGWYTGYLTFTVSNYNFFGDYEALLSRLVVTYEDGSKEYFVSDPKDWKAYKDGPVRSGSFFQGERYDATKEAAIKGWKEVGYDDSAWLPAERIEKRDWIDFDIVARYDEVVRLRETLTAQKVMPTHSADGHTYIYNMGVNMVGVPSITIPAGWLQKGDKVVLAYGEQVYPGLKGDKKEYVDRFGKKGRGVAGQVLFETNRAAMDIDTYIADGSGEVTIQPSATYRGFQYIQVTLPSHVGPLPLENVKGLVLSSSEIPTGRYVATTTDGKTGTLVNQLFKNIQRSQLGNFFTIPTDCPQRNERMGWTGDAQAYTRTGIYNANTQNFYRQWMVALRADQGVGSDTEVPGGIGSTVPTYNRTDDPSFATGTTWSAAVCQVPWQMYIQYGDKQIIEENIETMMDWLNGMAFYKTSEEHPYLSSKAAGLADWLALDNRTPSDIVNNAIYIYMMEVTAIMAEAIGRDDYAAILRDRHDKAKADWNSAYVNPVTGKTRDLNGQTIHTQASYATPLNFNCFSDANKAKAEAYLAELAANPTSSGPTAAEKEAEKNLAPAAPAGGRGGPGGGGPGGASTTNEFKPWTITTGFSGTPNILPALTRGGYVEEAFKMITCTDFASWLYPVTEGATSVWERWNSYDNAFASPSSNSMNSFNHFALGAVGQWMYEFQLGITTDHGNGAAGYQHFVLQPNAAGIYTSLEGCYESNYGTIKSAWTAEKGKMTSYKATIPANTDAMVYLPVADGVTSATGCDGAVFKGFTTRNNQRTACFEVVAGTYEFTIGNEITVK